MAPRFYTLKSQLPAGTMPGFKAGKGYYPRGRALPAAAAGDPFQQLSPQDITGIVNKYQGMLGTPVPDSQIASQAQSEIAPYLTQIEGDTAKQAAASAAQIKGLTDSYASLLGQTDYAAPYNTAATEQASVDAALKQALDKNGTDLASGLSSRLSALQDPAVTQTASDLAGRGQAIGTTQLASGSAALSNLIANAAAAGNYGAKQPGIARNSGIQALGQSAAQHEHDLTAGVQQAESQLPQIIQAIQSSNQSLRGNQAQLGSNLYQALTGQNITKATAKAGLVGDQTNAKIAAQKVKVAQAAADNAARTKAGTVDTSLSKTLGVLVNAQGDPILKGGKIISVPTSAGSAAPKANASLSKSLGYVVDASGMPILRGGKKITLPKTSTSSGPSSSQVLKWKTTALGLARNAHQGVTDAKGVAHPPLSWQQYLSNGLSEGIPAEYLIAQGKRVYSQAEIKQGLIPKHG